MVRDEVRVAHQVGIRDSLRVRHQLGGVRVKVKIRDDDEVGGETLIRVPMTGQA